MTATPAARPSRVPIGSGPVPAGVIDVRSVVVSFGDRDALRALSLRVESGTRVALLGPNGAGKTTLLRALAGLARPSEGEVRLGTGRVGPGHADARRSIGFVGHQSLLYPELTCRENLRFYARLYDVPDPEARAAELLGRLGLYQRRDDRLSTLSRGMEQRLALARALLHDPPILLLDEPDAGLDVEAFATLERVLGEDAARTVLLTTHSLEHALALCERVVILDRGRVVDDSTTAGLDESSLQRRYAAATRGAGASGAAGCRPGPAGW